MSSFEFKVVNNLSGREGIAEGYFAVQTGHSSLGGKVIECLYGIERVGANTSCIPIATDEFGIGGNLNMLLSSRSEVIASFITFGTDESRSTFGRISSRTHTETVAYELGRVKPGFLAVHLEVPGFIGNMEWRQRAVLEKAQARYGSVTVEGEYCLIELDQNTPALPGFLND